MIPKPYRIQLIAFAIAALSMIVGYRLLIFEHSAMVFNDPMEDMSYAWYVPIFSLYVVWRERREILATFGEPSWLGALAILPFVFAGFLGARGGQVRLEIVGFAGMLGALTWACFGLKTLKRVAFPIGFLLFCIPLHTYLDMVTIHLRLLAVAVSTAVLDGCGVDIVRRGTMLAAASGSFSIDVAEPCSGMRSLFAMMALSAGYAYFTQPTWLRRGILFALSIPLAVVGNICRVLSIAAVAATCSPKFALGFYHDYSGFIVFAVALVAMVAVGGLITKGAQRWARQ